MIKMKAPKPEVFLRWINLNNIMLRGKTDCRKIWATYEPLQRFFLKRFYLFIIRGEGREKERERNISVWLPLVPPTGDLADNPGMCPDWESNQ